MDKHEIATGLLEEIRKLNSKVENVIDEYSRLEIVGSEQKNNLYAKEVNHLKWIIHDLDTIVLRLKTYEISHLI